MKFSIRDLFWLTVVVALAVGWWVERIRAERLAEEAKVTDAAEAVILRHMEKLEEENEQLRKTLEESPNPSAPAPDPPKP